ncbi:hypothetical protein DFH08DRAFT_333198 [Mycena albidolilacea]|uniref:Uncharacterized protein n=1 Tax=Mycena albidolilacea TaxID=1033008 RepID=A0AAD6ZKM4_9AGAR|nr:hypothetical protein DFH08DRAFT_333198 [Mycena albidolilacea]
MSRSKSTTALGVDIDVVLDAVTHVLVFFCVSARVTPFSTRGTSFELRKRHSSPAPARAGPHTMSGDESEARTGGKLPWSTQPRSGLGARAEGEERVLGRRGEVERVRGRRVSPEASVERYGRTLRLSRVSVRGRARAYTSRRGEVGRVRGRRVSPQANVELGATDVQ